jgi:DNA-binding transcriptional regulator YdaS (Cro superfamily)
MKTQDAIAHFGSASQLASAVGISRAAVSQWGVYVPPGTASRLEKMTSGALVFDPSVYRHNRGRLWAPAHQAA